MADGRNVVNQAQFLEVVTVRSRGGVDLQVREGEDAGQTPLVNGSLNLGGPQQVGRAVGTRLLNGYVIVGTSNLVLGAILALRKAFVTPNVPLLARLTALARLGVAATRRTTAGTSHCCRCCEKTSKAKVAVVHVLAKRRVFED